MNDDELAELIRQESCRIERGGIADAEVAAQAFRDVGIIAKVHVGKETAEFDRRMTLEWFAGSLVSIVDNKSWFAINSWVNCTPKFTI